MANLPAVATPPKEELTAAEIGTAHHTFLQFVMLSETSTEASLRGEAHRLHEAGVLTATQVEALDFKALLSFWQSDLGQRIRAQPEAVVNREMPFTIKFPLAEIQTLLGLKPQHKVGSLEGEFVIVQGVADLAVLLSEEIWLVDFKTDHLAPGQLPARRNEYEPQMKIYALALGRIFKRPVTQCWLHFLSLNQSVAVGEPVSQSDSQHPPKPPAAPKAASANGQLVFDWLTH